VYGRKSQKYLAYNYDYALVHGIIGTNLRGTIKENGRSGIDKVIRWEVKYGSVSFCSYSAELPTSGMNEAGLAITLMWHNGGDFGDDTELPQLSPLQWIQYQLDSCATVDEVIDSLSKVRPRKEHLPLHYTLLDVAGNHLLIEFVDGMPKIYRNAALPIMTNTTYPLCLEELAASKTGSSSGINDNTSIARFIHLADQRSAYLSNSACETDGIELLDSVNQTPGQEIDFPWNQKRDDNTVTAWSIVFNPLEKHITFKTASNPSIRAIDLSDIDFDQSADYRMMDVHCSIGSSVTEQLKPFDKEKLRDNITLSLPFIPGNEEDVDNLVATVDALYRTRVMPS